MNCKQKQNSNCSPNVHSCKATVKKSEKKAKQMLGWLKKMIKRLYYMDKTHKYKQYY